MDKERWRKLRFEQQLGNIGAEVSRARFWADRGDRERFRKALERVLELIDLTRETGLRRERSRELGLLRELVADHFCGGGNYETPMEVIETICLLFAPLAREQAKRRMRADLTEVSDGKKTRKLQAKSEICTWELTAERKA